MQIVSDPVPASSSPPQWTHGLAGAAALSSMVGPLYWIVVLGPKVSRMAATYDPGCDNWFGAGSGFGETVSGIFWWVPILSMLAVGLVVGAVATIGTLVPPRRAARWGAISVAQAYGVALVVGAVAQSMVAVMLSLAVVTGWLVLLRTLRPVEVE